MTNRKPLRSAALPLCLVSLFACSQPEGPGRPDETSDGPAPAAEDLATVQAPGDPFDTPKGQWTWVDVPESYCNDGSHTGVGVRRTDSKNVVIYLMGGGACWDYDTCVRDPKASLGPVGKDQFVLTAALLGTAELFNRTLLRDWNAVFVPYCTGDVHGGDNVVTYKDGADSKTFHHKGRANMVAFLKRIAATWPDAAKVVVSGSSAGGYGAAMNFDLVRRHLPRARGYLVDDCGPPLVGDDIARPLREAWSRQWKLDRTLAEVCQTCGDDLAALIPAVAGRYPTDRLALLAFTEDRVIRSYFMQTAQEFEAKLGRLAKELDKLPNFRYFFIRSTDHVMLFEPGKYTAQGVKLTDWLTQQVSDDPAWATKKP